MTVDDAIARVRGIWSSRGDNSLRDAGQILADEIERLQEDVACYEAMKRGVTVRIYDLEGQVERLKEGVKTWLEEYRLATNARVIAEAEDSP